MAFPPVFRIFYSTFFTINYAVLLILIIVTPVDTIHQALQNHQLYNVFVIAATYFVTLVLAILIYASRLYTTRTVLAGIPKTYIPVEKGDVSRSVRWMIVESLNRNAVIAWEAKPRVSPSADKQEDWDDEDAEPEANEKPRPLHGLMLQKQKTIEKHPMDVSIPSHQHIWNEIAHDGWAPPTSPDIPDLEYMTVIRELPHLIEAKAVSLAPSDPISRTNPPMPDMRAVEILQRSAAMGLLEYIAHLTKLGILPAAAPVSSFVASYEVARFAARPLDERSFRDLTKLFAEILRLMVPMSPELLDSLDEDLESDIDGDVSSTPTNSTPRSRSLASTRSSRSGSQGTIRTARSRHIAPAKRLLTAPSPTRIPPRGRGRDDLTRMPSTRSFPEIGRHYASIQASSSDTSSLSSTSTGSVIRLSQSRSYDELSEARHGSSGV